jgi:hypothetical protein
MLYLGNADSELEFGNDNTQNEQAQEGSKGCQWFLQMVQRRVFVGNL